MNPQKKYDVFISYSHVDRIIADGICGYLEQHDISCFIDYRDIPKGLTWAKIIPGALRNSQLMIAVFSKDFNLSEQTDNEVSIAANRHIPMLAFRIADADFNGLKEYYLTKSNWIEAFPEPEKFFGNLLNSVQILLNISGRTPIISKTEEVSDEITQLLRKAKAYYFGINQVKDKTRGVYLYGKAAKLGNGEAAFMLGKAYYEGVGVSHSWEEAKKYFSDAVTHGNPDAMYQLAYMYHYGIGVELNRMKALELYTNAADLGDGKAMKMLGRTYLSGELGIIDSNRSSQYYEQSSDTLCEQALENNNLQAQYELANSYMDGEGVALDYQQAINWYQRTASNGYAHASNALGICYCRGMGVHLDLEKGYELQLKAAQDDCRIAQWNTAYNYLHGIGTKQDIKEGFNWTQKAARGGIAPAQCAMAKYYAQGKNDFEIDLLQAEKWYRLAISSGSLDAMYQLGKAYESSLLQIDDPKEEAFLLYKKAAMRNHTLSYIALGDCYFDKNSKHYNPIESARWYEKIATIYEDMRNKGEHFFVTECGAGFRLFLNFEMEYKQEFKRAIKNLAYLLVSSDKESNNNPELAKKWNTIADSIV